MSDSKTTSAFQIVKSSMTENVCVVVLKSKSLPHTRACEICEIVAGSSASSTLGGVHPGELSKLLWSADNFCEFFFVWRPLDRVWYSTKNLQRLRADQWKNRVSSSRDWKWRGPKWDGERCSLSIFLVACGESASHLSSSVWQAFSRFFFLIGSCMLQLTCALSWNRQMLVKISFTVFCSIWSSNTFIVSYS